MLATGSGDGTARIWRLPSTTKASDDAATLRDSIVLECCSGDQGKDVTCLEWHPDGQLLATGGYDGQARIFTRTGTVKFVMTKHSGPIFSLKWNKKGDVLLTGSVDKTAICWDAMTGEIRQQFCFHTGAFLLPPSRYSFVLVRPV